jgi:hypothetical protein
MTEGEIAIARNLMLAGQLTAMVMIDNNPRELKAVVKQIDPDVLQAFLDSKPEGFLYTEQIQQAIRLARTFKSLGKG